MYQQAGIWTSNVWEGEERRERRRRKGKERRIEKIRGEWNSGAGGWQKGDALCNTTELLTFHCSQSANVKAMSISKEKATI